MRIVDPLVVHRYAEEPSRAERLHFRVPFFERTPHRFLPLIDAEEQLRSGSCLDVG
jgi:hypothetical protein